MDVRRGAWASLLLLVCAGLFAIRWLSNFSGPVAEISGPAAANPSATASDDLSQIRVLLSSAPRTRWTVRVDGPYRIVAPDGWRVLAEGPRLAESEVTAGKVATGAWGLRIGDRTFSERRLHIDAGESGTLWVERRRYRGGLTLLRSADGQVSAVNRVDLEHYVASVLNGEMPGTFPAAARRAQAIVSRSYALFQMKAAAGKEFDVYDSARSQVYRGIEMIDAQGRLRAVENDDSRRVAAETRGVVLLDRGRSFCPFYGAVCGGHTARGEDLFHDTAAPLCGVACGFCGDAPRYRWQIEVPRATALARLAAYLTRTGHHIGEIESLACDDPGDGRLPSVVIRGRQGTASISSATLKQEVLAGDSLPSPFFSISFDRTNARDSGGPRLVIRGRGWGHGVGLCQWGARGMALAGSDHAAILAHYYPGSTLSAMK